MRSNYLLCVLSLSLLFSNNFISAGNWGQWRGPQFNGSCEEKNLPREWDVATKKNVVWSTALPGPGAATPAVWGNYVFVTAADKAAKQALALGLSAIDGTILWQWPLAPDRSTPGDNDMASPSPVTDGQKVWFLTGNGRVACFAVDGKELWRRNLAEEYGEFAVCFGYSSSPLLYENRLYILALQNNEPGAYGLNKEWTKPLESYLLALDPATGKTLWKQVRNTDAEGQSREAYVTPYPYEHQGRKEIILSGGECVTGHDPATGEELWRWWFIPADREKLQHVVPSVVGDEQRLFVIRPEHRPLFALRAGGSGQLGDKDVLWTWPENKSWIATPLLYQGRLYVPQEIEKQIACLDPATGRLLWLQELPVAGKLQASLLGADDAIYCISLDGEVVIMAPGDEYRQLALIDMNEKNCRASMVAANGRLYIRTGGKVYCLQVKKAE